MGLWSKVFADVGKYLFWIFIDHLILKTKDRNAMRLEIRLSFGIVRLAEQVVVASAVQLDRDFFAGTVKVNDVRADAVLASELAAFELALFQSRPQPRLGGCPVVAQVLAALL